MEVANLKLDKIEARRLYREYAAHKAHATPMDREIQRTYRLIAQGRVVIQALESIKLAGLDAEGLPRLALCRADIKACELRMGTNGDADFLADVWPRRAAGLHFSLPAGTFPPRTHALYHRAAALPLIPIHLRPRAHLEKYHILWEAEWRKVPPRDPYLLRRVGGDMWLVVAAWDLTDVERAAMSTRMTS